MPDPTALDDQALLPLLRQGRAKAYEQLMRRYNRLLFRAARGIVHDDAEAQDAVQETWLRVFLAVDAFRGESALATWLVRIAINQALGQQRKLGRLVPWDGDPGLEESAMAADDPTYSLQPATPEEEAARNELRHRLEAAIDLLPPIYRCVLILRGVQGLSVEETADALQVSRDVVKTRYLRARGMLRAHLGADEAALPQAHDFLGQRCDDLVGRVLAGLRAAGVIRDH